MYNINSNEYFTVSCLHTFSAHLTTDNLPLYSKVLSIDKGRGFPLEISIESNTKCTYHFDSNKYNDDYSNANKYSNKMFDAYKRSNDFFMQEQMHRDKYNRAKEEAMREKNKNRMEKYVDNYEELYNSNDILENYKNYFNNIKSVIELKDDNKVTFKTIELLDKSNSIGDVQCDSSNNNMSSIYGRHNANVSTKHCNLNLRKTIQVPISCLSMVNGESVECNLSANNMLTGGNKVYIPSSKTSGYISLTLKNATMNGKDVILDGSNDGVNPYCKFNNNLSDSSVLFRQIELADPFVQTYSSRTRGIGKNWNNDNLKYNFTRIIKSDTWNGSSEYQYTMSKVDASSIKSNTSSSGVRSYLGENCYFRDDNKFICPFIRPSSSSNGSSNKLSRFFTKIKVSD